MMISVSFWCGNISNLVSVIQTPDFKRKFCLDSSPCIFSFVFVIGTKLNPTEFSFKFRTDVLSFVELSDSNVSPMRNLNFSNDFTEIDLGLVIDSMNSMIDDCERRNILSSESNSWKSFFLSIIFITTKSTEMYRILANL